MPQKNFLENIPWWVIIIFFAAAWPVGLILSVLKLIGQSGFQRKNAPPVWEHSPPQQREVQRQKREDQKQAQPSVPVSNGRKKLSRGRGVMIGGGIAMGIFAISLMDVFGLLVSDILEGYWRFLISDISLMFPELLFFLAGAGALGWGIVKENRYTKYSRYLGLLGQRKRVSVEELAMAVPAQPSEARRTLQKMIRQGYLGPRAFLDYETDELILTGLQHRQTEPQKKAPSKTEQAKPEETEDQRLLRRIREVNDSIDHPELSRKIDRIEEITAHILEYRAEHPDKDGELRKFLNYYLPTTLKILEAYAVLEEQPAQGKNIAATRARIEGMMDMVVEGFERQLDKLFEGDMMDIASDISVLEKMMRGDGLSSNGLDLGQAVNDPASNAAPESTSGAAGTASS